MRRPRVARPSFSNERDDAALADEHIDDVDRCAVGDRLQRQQGIDAGDLSDMHSRKAMTSRPLECQVAVVQREHGECIAPSPRLTVGTNDLGSCELKHRPIVADRRPCGP